MCLHTLFSAWGAPSPEERTAKTDAAIGPIFYYSDPNAPDPIEGCIQGREAFSDYIAQFTAMMRGQYFADMAEDRLLRLIGFSGMGEPD
jgi:hypothetical protein